MPAMLQQMKALALFYYVRTTRFTCLDTAASLLQGPTLHRSPGHDDVNISCNDHGPG